MITLRSGSQPAVMLVALSATLAMCVVNCGGAASRCPTSTSMGASSVLASPLRNVRPRPEQVWTVSTRFAWLPVAAAGRHFVDWCRDRSCVHPDFILVENGPPTSLAVLRTVPGLFWRVRTRTWSGDMMTERASRPWPLRQHAVPLPIEIDGTHSLADLDADGCLDVAAVGADVRGDRRLWTAESLRAVRDGAASEHTRTYWAHELGYRYVAMDDVDDDGRDDILIFRGRAAMLVRSGAHIRYVSDGLPLPLPDACSVFQAAALDLDGDGRSDVATTCSAQAVVAFSGSRLTAPGTSPIRIDPPPGIGYFATSLTAAGDFDSDGYGDIAVASARPGAIHVFRGGPDLLASGRTYTLVSGVAMPDAAVGTGFGDIDGDGFDDFAFVSAGRVFVCRGADRAPRSGTCQPFVPTAGVLAGDPTDVADPRFFVVPDQTGDGRADVLFTLNHGTLMSLAADGVHWLTRYFGEGDPVLGAWRRFADREACERVPIPPPPAPDVPAEAP